MDLEEMNDFLNLAEEALKKVHQIQLDSLKSKYIAIQEEYKEEKGGKGD
jgi:hypothetical protein